MSEEITYRQVEETDADSVFLVDKIRYEELEKPPLSLPYIKFCIRLYQDTFLVAMENDKIVGFCIGLSSKTSSLSWISALTVSKDYKGRSIGESLVRNVCEKLKNIECSSVLLTAEPNLVAYYEKLGFAKISEELKNYQGEGEHRFILRKTL